MREYLRQGLAGSSFSCFCSWSHPIPSASRCAFHSEGSLLSQNEDSFDCINCHQLVVTPPAGTSQRNHCPRCLWSRHVDFQSGDRRSVCKSAMEPVAVWVKP